MSPDQRREAIIEATRPLLYEHGRDTTTKLIAEAAGIAEGTIFRSFSTKDELFDAVLEREFDPEAFLVLIAEIDPALPLRDRLVAYTGAAPAPLPRHLPADGGDGHAQAAGEVPGRAGPSTAPRQRARRP